MSPTHTQSFVLSCDRDGLSRVIRGKLDGPRGFADARPALPHVIVIHGFKGFMDWGFFPEIARRLAERGMVAIRFNMSGSGIGADLETFSELDAFATNTISRELSDLADVRAWIRDRAPAGIDRAQAALIGHSRGGGLALLHGADHPELASIVGWAAIDDVDRFDAATKALWREQGHVLVHNARTGQDLRLDLDLIEDIETHRDRLDITAACRRLTVPTLLIHGGEDESVPVAALARLGRALDAGPHRTQVLPGTGHTFGVRHSMTSEAAQAPRERAQKAVRAWDELVRETIAWIEGHWP